MISLDTNVVVRLFVDDGNHLQIKRARHVAAEAKKVLITQIVQIELVWVLTYAYNFQKTQILQILYELNDNSAFILQNALAFFQALKQFELCNADFSDCLMLMESKHTDSLPIYTFDKKFSKLTDVELLE